LTAHRAERDNSDRKAAKSRSLWNRQPSLRPVLVAEALSSVGDAVFWVGLLVWALDRPHGTAVVALAAIARLGPRALLGASGVRFTDRFDRRRLLVGLDCFRALLMVAIAWIVAADGSTTIVLGVVFVTYVLAVPYRPGFTAAVPLIVGERDAAPANALARSVRQIATFLGPLLGALVVWMGAPQWAIFLNAATFALSGAFLAGVKRLSGVPRPLRSHRASSVPTHTAAATTPTPGLTASAGGLRVMMALTFAFSVARGAELVLLVLVARDRLGMGAEGVGILNAAIGVGAIAAVPFIARVVTIDRPTGAVIGALVLSSVPLALLAAMVRPAAACTALVGVGIGIVMFEVLAVSLLQRMSHIAALARVFGIENMMVNGGKLAGSLLAPLLVAMFSLQVSLIVVAAIVVLSAFAAAPGLARITRATTSNRRAIAPIVDVLANLDLFAGASELALERLARTLRPIVVPGGELVIVEGAEPDSLFIVRSGHLDVTKEEQKVASLGPDDWFGEIGLLHRVPRTATVLSAETTELWQIPGADFLTALNESALPPAALLEGISARLAELDSIELPAS
jgi:predicted MFS family arabinose efflux permease